MCYYVLLGVSPMGMTHVLGVFDDQGKALETIIEAVAEEGYYREYTVARSHLNTPTYSAGVLWVYDGQGLLVATHPR